MEVYEFLEIRKERQGDSRGQLGYHVHITFDPSKKNGTLVDHLPEIRERVKILNEQEALNRMVVTEMAVKCVHSKSSKNTKGFKEIDKERLQLDSANPITLVDLNTLSLTGSPTEMSAIRQSLHCPELKELRLSFSNSDAPPLPLSVPNENYNTLESLFVQCLPLNTTTVAQDTHHASFSQLAEIGNNFCNLSNLIIHCEIEGNSRTGNNPDPSELSLSFGDHMKSLPQTLPSRSKLEVLALALTPEDDIISGDTQQIVKATGTNCPKIKAVAVPGRVHLEDCVQMCESPSGGQKPFQHLVHIQGYSVQSGLPADASDEDIRKFGQRLETALPELTHIVARRGISVHVDFSRQKDKTWAVDDLRELCLPKKRGN